MAKKKMTNGKSSTKNQQGRSKPEATVTRTCGCMQSHFALLDKYPEGRVNRARIEAHTGVCLNCGPSAFRAGVTTIPVVVHVLYRTASENISDAQIKSQIRVLNKDFLASNADRSLVPAPFKPLVADAMIEFKLADKDPNGNPSTGITRTQTTAASFGIDDEMKSASTGGADPWDTEKYLNIWVCTLRGGLLGYAQFPGFPTETDGVVVLNTAFGTTGSASAPFNLGRTTTHEVGHYLNLSHIWGESVTATCSDDDFVTDTPGQFTSNGGKPTFPHISCNNGPHGDMFMNYMDYVDDDSMFMFTSGQVARMQATLTGPRSKLGTI